MLQCNSEVLAPTLDTWRQNAKFQSFWLCVSAPAAIAVSGNLGIDIAEDRNNWWRRRSALT